MAARKPTEVTNPQSLGGGYAERHGMEKYRAEYEAGWTTAGRTSDSSKYGSGGYTWAWEDGYLDRAAGREKWHITRCPLHDNIEGGCGVA